MWLFPAILGSRRRQPVSFPFSPAPPLFSHFSSSPRRLWSGRRAFSVVPWPPRRPFSNTRTPTNPKYFSRYLSNRGLIAISDPSDRRRYERREERRRNFVCCQPTAEDHKICRLERPLKKKESLPENIFFFFLYSNMARPVLIWLMIFGGIAAPGAASFCNTEINTFPNTVCFIESCTNAIRTHIKEELNAAFKYMYMATHFAQVTINRPGIAKFLFEAATEERGHAILMLDYLNKRGVKGNFETYSLNITDEVKDYDMEYKAVLLKALELEIQVTNLIYGVVKECSVTDDYHAADVFTNPILDEQHESIRKLQGAIRTFDDLITGHTGQGQQLAVYMFDRKMLNGEF